MPPRHLGRPGAYRPVLAALDPESSSIFRPMPAGCRRFLMSYEWVGAAYCPDVAVMCRIAAKLAGLWSGSSPMSVFARRLRSRRQLERCADSCAVGLAVPAAGVVTSSRAGCALMAEGTSSSTDRRGSTALRRRAACGLGADGQNVDHCAGGDRLCLRPPFFLLKATMSTGPSNRDPQRSSP